MARLCYQVRPGGWMVIDHYTYTLSHFTKTAGFFRMWLKRLPVETSVQFTEKLVDCFLPLHRAARRFRIAQMVISRFSPALAYYHAFPELPDKIQREWALLDTHDSIYGLVQTLPNTA